MNPRSIPKPHESNVFPLVAGQKCIFHLKNLNLNFKKRRRLDPEETRWVRRSCEESPTSLICSVFQSHLGSFFFFFQKTGEIRDCQICHISHIMGFKLLGSELTLDQFHKDSAGKSEPVALKPGEYF